MELLKQYGYTLVFSVILLKQLGLPIPTSPVLLLAGALAAAGHLSLAWVVIAGIVGAFIGDAVWYWIGRNRGRGILKMLCHVSLSPESCVRKTESSFLKYGINSLLFAKFVPGLNTIAPPMAGMFSSRVLSFVWRDLAGILFYVGCFTIIGYYFEKTLFEVTALLEQVGRTVFWTILAALALYVAWKYLKLKILQSLLFRERITVEELYERFSAGEPLTIVDIRRNVPADDAKQIPGAIRIPPGEIDQHIQRLDKDRWIIMYCT